MHLASANLAEYQIGDQR